MRLLCTNPCRDAIGPSYVDAHCIMIWVWLNICGKHNNMIKGRVLYQSVIYILPKWFQAKYIDDHSHQLYTNAPFDIAVCIS